MRLPFRADIQGLRGIAILLVVFYHVGVPGLGGGFIGVDIFFVLSGFLISGLLFEEAEFTGTIDLGAFYARRIRRLLPAAVLVLIVTLIAASVLLSPLEHLTIARSGLATALYISNFHFMRNGVGYFDSRVEDDPLLHTWSLGVEEQFYLVWPLLILVCAHCLKQYVRVAMLLAIVISSLALCIWLTYQHPAYAFYGSPFRAWQFALGALAWIGARNIPNASGWNSVGLAGFITLIVAAFLIRSTWAYPGVAALIPSSATAAILFTSAPLLRDARLQWVGRLSYSWYLWHWPALVLATSLVPELTLFGRLAVVVAALVLSYGTYRFVENPVRYHSRLADTRRSLLFGLWITAGAAAAAVAFYGVAIYVTRSAAQRPFLAAVGDRQAWSRACFAAARDTVFTECVYGDTASPRTIVLFGDSHAEQWLPVLDDIARKNGLRVITFLRGTCPVAHVEVTSGAPRGLYECSRWRAATVARIAQLTPEAVILGSYQASFVNEAFSTEAERVTKWTSGYRSIFLQLDSVGTRIIVLRDTPRPRMNVPFCLSRAAYNPLFSADRCDTPLPIAFDAHIAEVQRVAAQGLDVRVVDLTGNFCSNTRCAATVGGVVVYRDDSHVTASFARTLEPDFARELLPLIPHGPRGRQPLTISER